MYKHGRGMTTRGFYEIILGLLFLQVIFLPKIYMIIKLAFLFLAIVICLSLSGLKIKITKANRILLFLAFWNIGCIIHGIIVGYGSAAIRVATVDVLWPLAYFFLSSVILNGREIRWLFKSIVRVAEIHMALVFCFLIIYKLKITPLLNIYNALNLYAGAWYSPIIHFRLDHMNYYSFFCPFIFALFFGFKQYNYRKYGVSRIEVGILAVISAIITILTGMGAIWLASAIGVILCLIKYYKVLSTKCFLIKIVSLGIVAFVIISYSYYSRGFSYYVVQDVLSRLGKSSVKTAENGLTRIYQLKAAIDAWATSPIFGVGRGVPISYLRDNIIYNGTGNELSYFVILYQRGLVGLLTYFGMYYTSLGILRRRKDICWFAPPYIIGMISIIISDFFNPFLSNFSFLWIVYDPFLMGGEMKSRKQMN